MSHASKLNIDIESGSGTFASEKQPEKPYVSFECRAAILPRGPRPSRAFGQVCLTLLDYLKYIFLHFMLDNSKAN